jgi:hypothetical protein
MTGNRLPPTAKCPDATEYDRQARLMAAARRLERLQGKAEEAGDAASAPIMPK